jgi:hypothetical protein
MELDPVIVLTTSDDWKAIDSDFMEGCCVAMHYDSGDYMGDFVAEYYDGTQYTKNYNVRIYRASIISTYGRNSHFQIAWLPMDSKSRTVIPEEPTEEITEYRTNGGFHGDEKNIMWVGNKIKSRKDFAEIVFNYIKTIFK